MTVHTRPRHCQSFTLHLWDTRPQGRPCPWRIAPSQALLPPQPPTPVCEGLPTAWSGCCGSRNTLAHCPVSSLGEKGEEALAGALGTALPFAAHRKFVSSPIPPPWLIWRRQDKPHIPPVCPSCLSLAAPVGRRCQGTGQHCHCTVTALPGHTPSWHTHSSFWDTHQYPSTRIHRCFPKLPAWLCSSAHVCEHTYSPCAAHRH